MSDYDYEFYAIAACIVGLLAPIIIIITIGA